MTDPLAPDLEIQNLPGQVGKALRNAKRYHRCPTSLLAGCSVLDVGSTDIVAAINGQTTDLELALLAQTTSLTANIQAIVNTLNAGIDVNSTQAGVWTFTVAGQPIETSLDALSLIHI